MTGVVLDTNVLVSANLSDEGLEAFVVSLALSGRLTLFASEPILAEYERVLNYPRLKFLPAQIASFLKLVRQASTIVSPTAAVTAARHEPDNRFLECAEAASADFLVTGNLKHFPARWKTTRIVNSRQLLDAFLEQLRQGK
jgi:uncharacterized protein